MTEQETQQVKDTALARCIHLKRNASIANEAINQTADALEAVAQVLRSPQRADFVFESRAWLNPDALYRIIAEAEKAQQDYADARAVAASLNRTMKDGTAICHDARPIFNIMPDDRPKVCRIYTLDVMRTNFPTTLDHR